MNTPATQAPGSAADFARRIALVLGGLRVLASFFFARTRRENFIFPLWQRFGRAIRYLDRLILRLNAGIQPRPPRPRPYHPRATRPTQPPAPLPRQHGWLHYALAHHAAVQRGHLEILLAEPGAAEFLAANPAVARILRPLGHMLGLDPALLPCPAPRRRPAARPKPVTATPAAPRPPRRAFPRLGPAVRGGEPWPWWEMPGRNAA